MASLARAAGPDGHSPLLEIVRLFESKSNAERRRALTGLLDSRDYPYSLQDYRILGKTGRNFILSFGEGNREILATAHYDAISAGANDNASGVAVLVGLLGRLKSYRPANKIIAIFFDGEEAQYRLGPLRIGCFGSRAYVRKYGVANLLGMYNLELCGHGDAVAIWPAAKGDTPALAAVKKTLEDRKTPYGTVKISPVLFTSDHLFFRWSGLMDAFTLSAVPGSDAQQLETFVRSPLSAARLAFSRALGMSFSVPLMFRRLHTPEDRADYLSESALGMMLETVWHSLVRLDNGGLERPATS